jgi:hypothetical protein
MVRISSFRPINGHDKPTPEAYERRYPPRGKYANFTLLYQVGPQSDHPAVAPSQVQ